MTINECIKQLESLRDHCEMMFDDSCTDETDIWDQDITALDMAISLLTTLDGSREAK